MPKVTYNFGIGEKDDYRIIKMATEMYSAMTDFDEWLREQEKYHGKYRMARQMWYEILNERGVDLHQ